MLRPGSAEGHVSGQPMSSGTLPGPGCCSARRCRRRQRRGRERGRVEPQRDRRGRRGDLFAGKSARRVPLTPRRDVGVVAQHARRERRPDWTITVPFQSSRRTGRRRRPCRRASACSAPKGSSRGSRGEAVALVEARAGPAPPPGPGRSARRPRPPPPIDEASSIDLEKCSRAAREALRQPPLRAHRSECMIDVASDDSTENGCTSGMRGPPGRGSGRAACRGPRPGSRCSRREDRRAATSRCTSRFQIWT